MVKFLEKKSMLENFRANVLKTRVPHRCLYWAYNSPSLFIYITLTMTDSADPSNMQDACHTSSQTNDCAQQQHLFIPQSNKK